MSRPDDGSADRREERLLDFWSIGWVFVLMVVVCGGIFLWWLQGRLSADARPMIGDGRDVATYGFDLSTCLIPREQIVASGLPKDGMPALVNPEVLDAAGVEQVAKELRAAHQGKLLVPGDRVVGLSINGEARAYPLKFIAWHEVVNDTLGGTPVAVTYSPLCDSVVVFDRRVGDRVLEFGHSGLFYNSNLLMYDRRPDGGAVSLWSQLLFAAVSGPAAERGDVLEVLPAAVTHWSIWQAAHPDTTVLAPVRERMRVYKRTYSAYFAADKLLFPVDPLPPDEQEYKRRIIALRLNDQWHTYSLDQILAEARSDGTWATTIGDRTLMLRTATHPTVVWQGGGATESADQVEPLPTVYGFWFGWIAVHGGE